MVRYLYLDDETAEKVRPYIRAVTSKNQNVAIELRHPTSFGLQMSVFGEESFDGLILDLRLDQFPSPAGHDKSVKADYRATAIAQEIRTRATERKLPEFPLVMWSTDERLASSYKNDHTGHDLFDLKCVKNQMLEDGVATRVSVQLEDLVSGYTQIREIRRRKTATGAQLHRFLGFDTPPGFLDPKLLTALDIHGSPIPAHEYAGFIIRSVLERPGPLISAEMVAARLGIDAQNSGDFQKLLAGPLSTCRYLGVFSKGWERWWAHQIDQWWFEASDKVGALRSTSAAQRVKIIKAHTGLRKLTHATPIGPGYSDAFWTVCVGTGQPLDPKDGFLIDAPFRHSWQERGYASLDAEVEGRLQELGMRIDSLELDRLKRVKKRVDEG